jgi:hypothetical protein
MSTTTAVIKYIPYSAFNGDQFWLPSQHYGRDFHTLQEAQDWGYGAIAFGESPDADRWGMEQWEDTHCPVDYAESPSGDRCNCGSGLRWNHCGENSPQCG